MSGICLSAGGRNGPETRRLASGWRVCSESRATDEISMTATLSGRAWTCPDLPIGQRLLFVLCVATLHYRLSGLLRLLLVIVHQSSEPLRTHSTVSQPCYLQL